MKLSIYDPRQCRTCKHWTQGRLTCQAFPVYPGIPKEIFEGKFDHRQPHPGDHGIQWEPREPGVHHPLDEDQDQG